ncbi:MAG: DUF3006 domain-containing protein [Clostridia bacterium]|nr:DUF3006 domain-containing protein [Clostridia bacterium]
MEEILVVDRIENGIAVCENRSNRIMIELELSKLPDGVKEGTVIRYFDGEYEIDYEEQKNIEDRIKQKMDDLWN